MEVNKYFNGDVLSIGFENSEGKVTAGVMNTGEYTFGTSQTERMVVTSGTLMVKLPGEIEFSNYSSGSEFKVDANLDFDVKVNEPNSYLCFYGE